ncbi:MAG: fluoride efflux transporter CrcB [Prevotella sp.]|nr:fluoride efflux transporter CrcB [Prevotella sp.]MDE6011493.1 fluoride efflux transporter CrcB [Prevotella sp.]
MIKDSFYVFVGGGTGSCLRFLLSDLWKLAKQYPCFADVLFPWPTLLANIIGCLLIGIFYSHASSWQIKPEITRLLTTGLCGGFTTFSTFSWESLNLLRTGHVALFILYSILSLILGLFMVFLGTKL